MMKLDYFILNIYLLVNVNISSQSEKFKQYVCVYSQ